MWSRAPGSVQRKGEGLGTVTGGKQKPEAGRALTAQKPGTTQKAGQHGDTWRYTGSLGAERPNGNLTATRWRASDAVACPYPTHLQLPRSAVTAGSGKKIDTPVVA